MLRKGAFRGQEEPHLLARETTGMCGFLRLLLKGTNRPLPFSSSGWLARAQVAGPAMTNNKIDAM